MGIWEHREEVGLDTVGNNFTSGLCGSEMTTHVSKAGIRVSESEACSQGTQKCDMDNERERGAVNNAHIDRFS